MSLIPRHVLAHLLLRPFASWQRQWWRASPGHALAKVHRAVEEARALLIAAVEREAGSGVGSAWARCCRSFDLVTGVVARAFFDAGLVAEAVGAPEESMVRTDPILAWIAEGASGGEEIAGALPYRSVREWALEHPRLGEAAGSSSFETMLQAFMDRERCFPPVTSSTERAGRLLALARDNLSFGVAMLRWDLIELGAAFGLQGDAVFQRSWEELAASVESEALPESEVVPTAPDPRLPVAFSLVHLEAWAAGERDAQPEPSLGFWVSGSGPITGRVVTADAEPSAGDELRIQVVRHPEVRDLAALPDGIALVALGGNRLSHAAQVLRERGTPALFGAEAYADLLTPGARVILGADGRVTRAG